VGEPGDGVREPGTGRSLTSCAPGSLGVGVDVVGLDRLRRASALQDLLALRVLTAAERRWCDDDDAAPTRLATCLAVKEAAIKLLGGRPADFDWRDVAVAGDVVGPAEHSHVASPALASALPGLAWQLHAVHLKGSMLNGWARCDISGGGRGWSGMAALCGSDADMAVAVILAGVPGSG
jgi:phosphopantetheinyl transferase (holo-ACP synthase)